MKSLNESCEKYFLKLQYMYTNFILKNSSGLDTEEKNKNKSFIFHFYFYLTFGKNWIRRTLKQINKKH